MREHEAAWHAGLPVELVDAPDLATPAQFERLEAVTAEHWEIAELAVTFTGDFVFPHPSSSGHRDAADPVGEARVLPDGLGRKGVYRDDDGTLHGVWLRCTPLGCLVRRNAATRSWDCPCHGSRFGVDGEVLEGPATQPLASRSR